MEPFIDFDKCELIKNRAYGGAAGRKLAVLHDGEPWILKFPESTRNFPGKDKPNNHLPPYTTSPLSEYIGSRVYTPVRFHGSGRKPRLQQSPEKVHGKG